MISSSLPSHMSRGQMTTTISDGLTTPFGAITPLGSATPSADIDMKKIGQARNTLMDIKLTQVCVCHCPSIGTCSYASSS